ncbi:MAG: hypothetical protein KGY66_02720 [Candidatus Thermoplasmatota archaeon]|nr:hypothetical protein [Candidatus Thermoplasmatota archaeon]
MDLKEIDEIFSEFSEEVLALVSGIAMIITVIFFIYAVMPLYGDHAIFFWFSLLALLVCFTIPIFFRLSDLTLVPEVVSWLLTGITIAIFGWIIFHAGYYENIRSLSYIIPSGLLGFASSFPLTKGVLVPLVGEGELEILEIDDEIEEDEGKIESEIDEDFEEPEEDFGKTESDEDNYKKSEEAKDTSEEDEGPW